MLLLTKILLFSLFFCGTIGQRFYQLQVACKTPDDGIGTCVTLTNCPALVQLYGQNGGSQDVVKFLLAAKRNCGNRVIRNDPVVCCSETYSENRQSNSNGRQNNNFDNENRFQQNPNNPFLPNGNNNQFNPNSNNNQFNPNRNDQFNPDRNNQFNPNSNNQFNPNRNDQFNPDRNNKFNPNQNDQFNPNRNNQFNPNRNNQFNPSSNDQFNPDRNNPFNPNTNEQFNPDRNNQFNPNSDDQTNPNRNNQPNPNSNDQFNPNRDNQFNPNRNNQFNPNSNDQFNPDRNNPFDPNINDQFNPDGNNQFNPNSNNQFNPDRNNTFFPDSNDSRQPSSTESTQTFPFFPPPVEEAPIDERFPSVRSTTQRTTTSTRRTTTSTTTFRPPSTQRSVSTSTIQQTGNGCTAPDSRFGICRPLVECTELINRLQANPNDKNFVGFLRESNKICGQYSVVCCPKENRQETTEADFIAPTAKPTLKPIPKIEARILKPEEGCGQSNGEYKKIVGGEPANVGAYPWIALLGYGYDDTTQFRCGGALITKRHVLTASHCIRGDLKLVRLGEHDIDVDDESNHIDVKVKSIRRHPKYNPNDGHNDIAILYLAEDVRFSDAIRPICVPDVGELDPRDLIGYHPFTAGWGKTIERGNSSNILLEIQLPILANEDCKKRFAEERALKSEQQFDDAVICAGFLAGGKDTCQGDSGGPLMLPKKSTGNSDTFYFNLLGIISYGIGCARPGIPGVYASVPHFAQWIREMIADDNGA